MTEHGHHHDEHGVRERLRDDRGQGQGEAPGDGRGQGDRPLDGAAPDGPRAVAVSGLLLSLSPVIAQGGTVGVNSRTTLTFA